MGMITSCAVQMSDCVQASQYRPMGRTQPGKALWQHGESSCAQVLSSAAHSSDVGQTDTAFCLHMVVVYVSCLFACFLCTCCFLIASHDSHFCAWSSFFWSFERLADDGPPEVLWVHARLSIFKRRSHFKPFIGLHLMSGRIILIPQNPKNVQINQNMYCLF